MIYLFDPKNKKENNIKKKKMFIYIHFLIFILDL